MRVVVQRVIRASVRVDGAVVGRIGRGLMLLAAVHRDDGEDQVRWMARKIPELRIFADGEGKMNLSLRDIGGGVLLVSQFTLYGDCRKGRRPNFMASAPPDRAEQLLLDMARWMREDGIEVETGRFGAMMDVELVNDGPVTLVLDTPDRAPVPV